MPLNPFESKRNFGAHLAELGVRNGMVAEREELYSNVLSQIYERPRASSLLNRYFIEELCLTSCCLRSFLRAP